MIDCFVSIITPIHNDGKILEDFVAEIMTILRKNYTNYELILVNDGSEDETNVVMNKLLQEYECMRLINLSRHFGTEIAISSGLDAVIGDFVVIMLPEMDPPQLIPELIEQCREGNDILMGVRKNRVGESWWMQMGAEFFYWCSQKVFKIPLIKNSTHFRVISRRVVNSMLQVEDKYRYIRIFSAYIGYSNNTFTYQPIRRYRKPKLRGFRDSINLGLQIIFLNSVHPLRLASLLSLFISFLNLLYLGYILLIYLFKDHVVEGWITLSIQSSVMFFFISIILAILCEYIGLMFAKLRGWASYYIADEKNSSVLIVEPERRNIVKDSENIQV